MNDAWHRSRLIWRVPWIHEGGMTRAELARWLGATWSQVDGWLIVCDNQGFSTTERNGRVYPWRYNDGKTVVNVSRRGNGDESVPRGKIRLPKR